MRVTAPLGAGLSADTPRPFANFSEDAIAADARAHLSESGFIGFAGFSGFRFAHLALFPATGNPANPNLDKRLPVADARAGGILKIL